MTVKKSSRIRNGAAFTLVEMVVSLAILSIILLILGQATTAMRKAVTQTTTEVQEFAGAQNAFEVMTRRISQATLNAYNDTAAYTPINPTPQTSGTGSVSGYTRASELRFISGPASLASTALNNITGPLFTDATGATPYHPTHAIFFQAPLGTSSVPSLLQAMNTCGYYIEWNSDKALGIVPAFIPTATYTARWRFRLMEMIEPSDYLTIYSYTSGSNGVATTTTTGPASNSWTYTGKDWFQTPYKNSTISTTGDYLCARPIADNVILLAFLPMVSPQNALYPTTGGNPDGTSTDLMTAPSGQSGYLYDTAPIQTSPGPGLLPVSQNQLPPLVYVLMIAVDEKSFYAYQMQGGNSTTCPSNLGIDYPGGNATFLTVSTYTQRQSDVTQVETALAANHIKYRVFSSIVPLTAH